jgi:sugar/nucleoside kinase (ribokinase family)
MQITTLTVGHVTYDRFGDALLPGGCAYYAAKTFRALGARSRLVTVVGEDFDSEEAFAGLEVECLRSGNTTLFSNWYPYNAPRVQYLESQAPDVLPGLLPPEWQNPGLLFIGPVIGEIDPAAWRRTAVARMVAIGIQGFVRTLDEEKAEGGARRVVPRKWSPGAELLAGIDVAILSEEDMQGQGSLLEILCEAIPIVVLTRGRQGCYVIQGKDSTRVGIYPASEVDPSGAGDTFVAGFLFALARGDSPQDAARLGAACASIIIEGRAGETLERMDEAFQRAKEIV